MTEAPLCDQCYENEAFYYTGGVYTCATCAIHEIRSKLPKEYQDRLPEAIRD